MKNLLVYYGWMNSFNSGTNGWDNEKVAQDMARYDLIVLGDGLAQSGHGDYSNTKVIIPRIKALHPECQIFGYVSSNQSEANFESKVGDWLDNTDFGDKISGIFMDESGYDFSVSRETFNKYVDFVHGKGKICFANAWTPADVLGSDVDATYNSDGRKSNLANTDWFLMESFGYGPFGGGGSLQYESASQWKTRGEGIQAYCSQIQIASISTIDESGSGQQDIFDFIRIGSAMFNLDANGSSDVSYGASSAKASMWTRPDFSRVIAADEPTIESNGNKYFAYLSGSKLSLDFTTSSEGSEIAIY